MGAFDRAGPYLRKAGEYLLPEEDESLATALRRGATIGSVSAFPGGPGGRVIAKGLGNLIAAPMSAVEEAYSRRKDHTANLPLPPFSGLDVAWRAFGTQRELARGAAEGFEIRQEPPPVVEIPEERAQIWKPVLDGIYGVRGQHVTETAEEMAQNPEAQQRYTSLFNTMMAEIDQTGSPFSQWYAGMREEEPDQQARTFRAMNAYKAARKRDFMPSEVTRTQSELAAQAAMLVLPELNAIRAMKAAGVPAQQIFGSVLTSGSGAEFIAGMGKAAVGVGQMATGTAAGGLLHLAKWTEIPGVAKTAAKTIDKRKAMAKASFEAFDDGRHAARAAVGPRDVGPLPGVGEGPKIFKVDPFVKAPSWKNVAKDGELILDTAHTPTYGRLADIYGFDVAKTATPGWVAGAAMGALWGGMQEGEEGALAGLIAGGMAPPLIGKLWQKGKAVPSVAKALDSFKPVTESLHQDISHLGYVLYHLAPMETLRNVPQLGKFMMKLDDQYVKMDKFVVEYMGGMTQAFGKKNFRSTKWRRQLGKALDDSSKGLKVAPEMVEHVRQYRQINDKLFTKAVQDGVMSMAQYRKLYLGRVLDHGQMFRDLKLSVPNDPGRLITPTPGEVRALQIRALKAMDEDTLEMFALTPGKSDFLREMDKGTVNLRAKGLGDNALTVAEERNVREVAAQATKYGVSPSTLLDAMTTKFEGARRATDAGDAADELLAIGDVLPHLPKEVKASFTYARRMEKHALPLIEDPIDILLKRIHDQGRKAYMEPLIKRQEIMDPFTGEALTSKALAEALHPEWAGKFEEITDKAGLVTGIARQPLLKELETAFKGKTYATKLAHKLTKSYLGVPLDSEKLFDNLVNNLSRRTGGSGTIPSRGTDIARLLADMDYAGALAFKPMKAVRNLFQSLLTATAVGPKALAEGMYWVAKNPEEVRAMASKRGAVKGFQYQDVQDAHAALVTGAHPLWKRYLDIGFYLYKEADIRNRTWAFAAGYRKVLNQKGAVDLSIFRKDRQAKLSKLMDEAKASGDWDHFAGEYGVATADLTQWIYGKQGAPLFMRGSVSIHAGMFMSWPVNYVSLLRHWAKTGNMGKIIELSLAAGIVDHAMFDAIGLKDTTGITYEGSGKSATGLHQYLPMPIPLAAKPFPGGVSGSPTVETVTGLGQVLGSGAGKDAWEYGKGMHKLARNAPGYIPGVGQVLGQGLDAYEALEEGDTLAAALRALGGRTE